MTNKARYINSVQYIKIGGGASPEGDVGSSLSFSQDGMVAQANDLHTEKESNRHIIRQVKGVKWNDATPSPRS